MKKAVFDFTGQGVVVTGGATSVGRVMVEQFLAAGARVHTCDIDPAALEQTLAEVPGLSGSVTDVGDPDAVADMSNNAINELGHVDILVNNVGIDGPTGPLEELDVERWRQATDVNLNSMFFTAREFVPAMKENRHGVIINISSVSTKTHPLHMQNYNTTKTGVEGLTATLARELGEFGIRCNAIRPGGIDNQRAHDYLQMVAERDGRAVDDVLDDMLSFTSMRTLIDPVEIADAVLFFASPNAKHITGQVLSVCGGFQWD